jgi:LuxR family transcriptional regulator, quorum-sensing system regulator BjaR1
MSATGERQPPSEPRSVWHEPACSALKLESNFLPGNDRRTEPTSSDIADDVFSFANAVRDCKSLDACGALFRGAIAQYGFDTFACGEVDALERNRCVFYVVGWPPSWLDVYVKSGFIEHDPVVERAKHQALPFTWSELLADKKLSVRSRKVLQVAAEFGWTEGLAVPFTRTETRFGLVSLAGNRPALSAEERHGLSIMAMCLHEQARRIGPSLGVALALSALSLRELDALRLVARGHSDKQIAVLLGIAQSTAHEHVEAAKHKLKVKNRAEAAAVGVSLGLA